MPDVEQRRFLRHLRPWWDIHRHRMPPQTALQVDALRDSGRFQVLAGQVLAAETDGGQLRVSFRPRGEARPRRLVVGHMANCSGPCGDFTKIRQPLLAQMIADGLVRPDRLRLGLDVDPAMHLRDGSGRSQERLLALGPITKGRFWEATAVPEIRRQAGWLADHLNDLDGD